MPVIESEEIHSLLAGVLYGHIVMDGLFKAVNMAVPVRGIGGNMDRVVLFVILEGTGLIYVSAHAVAPFQTVLGGRRLLYYVPLAEFMPRRGNVAPPFVAAYTAEVYPRAGVHLAPDLGAGGLDHSGPRIREVMPQRRHGHAVGVVANVAVIHI